VQVLQSYLLVEATDGVYLIDQHALHEKVLFEEIHQRLEEGAVESQRLLIPEVLDLPAELMPLVEAAAVRLRPLGFEVEPFGERAAAIHAIPALFDREAGTTDPREIVRAALDLLGEGGAEGVAAGGGAPDAVRRELRRLAATIACKRAVKAGTALSPQEVEALLRRAGAARDPRFCPHGRPTTVFLSRRDLEKQFDRK
jgi:DNA mismatch repair protein MutL